MVLLTENPHFQFLFPSFGLLHLSLHPPLHVPLHPHQFMWEDDSDATANLTLFLYVWILCVRMRLPSILYCRSHHHHSDHRHPVLSSSL